MHNTDKCIKVHNFSLTHRDHTHKHTYDFVHFSHSMIYIHKQQFEKTDWSIMQDKHSIALHIQVGLRILSEPKIEHKIGHNQYQLASSII